jgi:chromosome segregation ATPase
MAEANNKDKVSTPDELNAVKAQLEEEQKAKTSLEQAMAEKDARLAELDAALSEAKSQSEASAADLASVKEARDQAVTKYLGMARASNPQVPEDMISGETIEEIDAAVEKGKGLVSAVKKTLESETAAAKVPAGAPTRGETTEGMSNKDMIAAGLRQKGGS